MSETDTFDAESSDVHIAVEMVTGTAPTGTPMLQKEEKEDHTQRPSTDDVYDPSFIIGRTRICDTAGYRGTVMYVGPVVSSSSKKSSTLKIYSGIIWDDITRGKHNGTVLDPNTNQFVPYFKIPSSYYDTISTSTTNFTSAGSSSISTATCASFVPIHKINRGVVLTKDIILSKYVPLDSTECVAPNTILPNCTVSCAPSSRNKSTNVTQDSAKNAAATTITRYKPIQLIGEYNIRRHQQLQINQSNCDSLDQNSSTSNGTLRQLHTISLRSYQLSSIDVNDLLHWTTTTTAATTLNDDPQQLVTHTIYEIDLAGNLFCHDWSSFHDVMYTFPNLQKFSMASNFIYDYTPPKLHHILGISNSIQSPPLYPHSSLQHLNLNGTKIQHLSTVYQIGRSFPNLLELIIANNRFDSKSSDDKNACFMLTTDTIETKLATSLLDHVLNIATDMAIVFPHLSLLDCSNCHLNYWSTQEVSPTNESDIKSDNSYHIDFNFEKKTNDNDSVNDQYSEYDLFLLLWSKLPKLHCLSLDDHRQFTKFIYPHNHQKEVEQQNSCSAEWIYFPSLHQLQCVHTGIADWMDIVPVWDEYIPTLRNLRFKHCPLVYGMSVSNIRHQLIGYCPALNMINATAVTEQERREVAKQIISNNAHLVHSNVEEPQSNRGRHRKYDYWASQYPDIASNLFEQYNRDSSPTSTIGTTASHPPYYTTNFAIVNVTFRSMASSSCTKEPFTRRLPAQMTIRKVKALCARHFDTELDDQILYFRHSLTNDDDSLPQIMDCNDHTLHYYGVPDGGEILMHEINDHRSNTRRIVNGADVNIQGTADDAEDEKLRQRRELDERVDRLEQEMSDFKLRQNMIAKK